MRPRFRHVWWCLRQQQAIDICTYWGNNYETILTQSTQIMELFAFVHDSKQFRAKNILITKRTFNAMELKQIFDFTGLFYYFGPKKVDD